MNEDRKKDRAKIGREWGTIISFLITSLSLGLDALSLAPNIPWAIFALISFLAFCFLMWKWISDLDLQLSDKIPNIDMVGEVNTHDVMMYHDEVIKGKKTRIVDSVSYMANICFANKPEHPTDNNHANNVRAEISYLDETKTLLFPPIQGRWSDSYQPSQLVNGQFFLIEKTDFPNTGAARWLDLLIKYPEEEFCYAYNNDSYHAPKLFLLPEFQIKKYRFFMQVRLIGSYLPKRIWEFEVETTGKGDTFAIRKTNETWIKANSHSTIKPIQKADKKSSSRKTSKSSKKTIRSS